MLIIWYNYSLDKILIPKQFFSAKLKELNFDSYWKILFINLLHCIMYACFSTYANLQQTSSIRNLTSGQILVRIDGSNNPLTEEEKIWINLRYGKLRNELQVYQAIRLQLLLNLLLMKSLKWVWKSFLFPCSSLQKSESVSATWEIAPETVYL